MYCLCFNMVSFRGKKKLGPHPDQSPLGVSFKIFVEHPHPFHMRSLPRQGFVMGTIPALFCSCILNREGNKINDKGLIFVFDLYLKLCLKCTSKYNNDNSIIIIVIIIIGVNVRLEVIQKTALLGTAKLLRKVLSL